MMFPKKTYKRRKPKHSSRNEFSKKTRQDIWDRENGACQCCGSQGEEIHHARFKSQSGRGVYSNGILLCHDCHTETHENRELADYWREWCTGQWGEDYYKDIYDKLDDVTFKY